MPLDNTTHMIAIPGSNSLVRLAVPKWGQVIRDFMAAKTLKKTAESQARAADARYKDLRKQLIPALAGAPSAVCGHAILTLKTTSAAEASITLADGSKLPWSSVQAVLVRGRRVMAEEIASVYGGRAGSEDLDIAGAV